MPALFALLPLSSLCRRAHRDPTDRRRSTISGMPYSMAGGMQRLRATSPLLHKTLSKGLCVRAMPILALGIASMRPMRWMLLLLLTSEPLVLPPRKVVMLFCVWRRLTGFASSILGRSLCLIGLFPPSLIALRQHKRRTKRGVLTCSKGITMLRKKPLLPQLRNTAKVRKGVLLCYSWHSSITIHNV